MSNIKTIFFSSEIVYHYFLNTNGLMHKNNFEYYLERDIEIHKKTGEIIKEYYENDKDLFIVNNTMSSYAIERNLFNIYKTTNEQELIKEYNKVRDYWKKISRETDYKYLKQSKYAVKGDYFIKKWLKEDITSIIKTYNKEIRIENVKRIIKKIIGR